MTAEIHLMNGDVEKYEQARILDSGWVKATEETGGSDYYAPHMVKHVTGRVYVGDP